MLASGKAKLFGGKEVDDVIESLVGGVECIAGVILVRQPQRCDFGCGSHLVEEARSLVHGSADDVGSCSAGGGGGGGGGDDFGDGHIIWDGLELHMVEVTLHILHNMVIGVRYRALIF